MPAFSKCNLSLRVGIVGNRNFEGFDESEILKLERFEAGIIRACQSAFRPIEAGLNQVAASSERNQRFSKEMPRIRFITALSKGGDQLGAYAALKHRNSGQATCSVELNGLMPFPSDQYPRTIPDQIENENFSERDLQRFDEIESETSSVVRIDGIYQTDADTPDDPSCDSKRNRGYKAQASMLLQHSDLLIAIWDQRAVGKTGGSEETVLRALEAGIPVVHIQPVTDGADIRFLSEPREARKMDFDGDWENRLRQSIIEMLAFPTDVGEILAARESESRQGDASRISDESHPSKDRSPDETFAEFFQEEGTFSNKNRIGLEKAWRSFKAIFQKSHHEDRRPSKHKEPTASDIAKRPIIKPYEDYLRRADELSQRYTNFYRGAFVLSYFLAAIAVMFALTAITSFHLYRINQWEAKSLWLALGVFCGFSKLVVIGWLLRNRSLAHSEAWQEKGGDFRFLSEMLRPMIYLAPLGLHTPNTRPPAHYVTLDPRTSWANWLFRTIIRDQPMVIQETSTEGDYTFCASDVERAREKVTDHWIPEQIGYHKKNHDTYHHMFHLVERLNSIMLWTVISAVAIHLVSELVYILGHVHILPNPVMFALLLIAALFPAVIAILTGLLYQADARRQSERSQVMANQLQLKALPSLQRLGIHPDGCQSIHVGFEIRDEIASIMIEEVADWQLLYRMDEVKAG